MDVKSHQRWDCVFAWKSFTRWFVLTCFTLSYSLYARGCRDSLHKIGEDIQLNCTVGEEIEESPKCRNSASNFMYQNCQQPRHCVDFENDTKSVIFTIANATEQDLITYECGVLISGTAKVNWTCCFNLRQDIKNPSPASSMTSASINTLTTATLRSQDNTSTGITIIQSSAEDVKNTSTGCVTEIQLKNERQYKGICGKETVSFGQINNMTNNCVEHLITNNGNGTVTFNFQYEGKSCDITCYEVKEKCEVAIFVTGFHEGTSGQSITTTGQGLHLWETTGQTDSVKSNDQHDDVEEKEGDRIVYTVVYISCGVIIALVVLITGLCIFIRCSGEKTSKTQVNLVQSRPLPIFKTDAQNSSAFSSYHEGGERNQNDEEKDSSYQNLVSDSSGLEQEDKIAHEACVNITEGDYADINDRHSINEDGSTSVIVRDNHEGGGRNQRNEEKDSINQNLVSESSGLEEEDNIPKGVCVNVTEGDYADINDRVSIKEDGTVSVIVRDSGEEASNPDIHLYTTVVKRDKKI